MEAIKMSEFYEKYFVVKLPNGGTVKPKLTDEGRKIMDKSQELGVPPYVVTRGRDGVRIKIHPAILEAWDK